jgi:hypothetical protein
MRILPRTIVPLAAAAVFGLPAVAFAHAGGAVYTRTNSPAGNALEGASGLPAGLAGLAAR